MLACPCEFLIRLEFHEFSVFLLLGREGLNTILTSTHYEDLGVAEPVCAWNAPMYI